MREDQSDEKLVAYQVAARLGIKKKTWSGYVSRGQAPQPDGRFGRQPWWWASTVETYRGLRRPGRRSDLARTLDRKMPGRALPQPAPARIESPGANDA